MIYTWIKQKVNKFLNHPFLFSLVLTIFFLGFMMSMGISYETNDDWNIALQLSRGEKSLSTFLLPELSIIFNKLYLATPMVPWWSCFSLLCVGVLLLVVLYITLRRCAGILKMIYCCFWFIAIWIGCVKQINFTRTAVAIALAGWLCVVFSIYIESKKWKRNIQRILGCCFISLGAMIRIQASLIIVPFIGLVLLFITIDDIKRKKTIKIERYAQIFLPIVVVCVMIGVTNFSWSKRSEWQAYQTYNYYRGIIQDYSDKYPDWDEAEELYEDIGLKEGDEELLIYNWFSEDTKVFNVEKLKKISNLSNNEISYKEYFEDFCGGIRHSNLFWIFVFYIFLLACVWGSCSWSKVCIETCCAFLIIGYFLVQGRIQDRVSDSVFLCAISSLFLVFSIREYKRTRTRIDCFFITIKKQIPEEEGAVDNYSIKLSLLNIGVGILGLTIIIMLNMRGMFPQIGIPSKLDGVDIQVREIADYIDSNDDKIFILPALTVDFSKGFSFWEVVPQDYCENLFFLGGWTARSPYNDLKLKKYEISNPIEGLIEDSKVYTIYDEKICEYIKRHYCKNVTCSYLDNFPSEENLRIVQYQQPINNNKDYDRNEVDIRFNVDQYENDDQNGGRVFSGEISGYDISEKSELYCNITIKGTLYTYRLNIDKNGVYYGYLYGLDSVIRDQIEKCSLIVKEDENDCINIGEIKQIVKEVEVSQ